MAYVSSLGHNETHLSASVLLTIRICTVCHLCPGMYFCDRGLTWSPSESVVFVSWVCTVCHSSLYYESFMYVLFNIRVCTVCPHVSGLYFCDPDLYCLRSVLFVNCVSVLFAIRVCTMNHPSFHKKS